jgi:hypothetical protein
MNIYVRNCLISAFVSAVACAGLLKMTKPSAESDAVQGVRTENVIPSPETPAGREAFMLQNGIPLGIEPMSQEEMNVYKAASVETPAGQEYQMIKNKIPRGIDPIPRGSKIAR